VLSATDQPATRSALLTPNWRGCDSGRDVSGLDRLTIPPDREAAARARSGGFWLATRFDAASRGRR